MKVCSATFDLKNRTPLKQMICSQYTFFCKQHRFYDKISFHEICFTHIHHHKTSILYDRAVYYGLQLDAYWASARAATVTASLSPLFTTLYWNRSYFPQYFGNSVFSLCFTRMCLIFEPIIDLSLSFAFNKSNEFQEQ